MAEVPPSPGKPPAEASSSKRHGSNPRSCEYFDKLDDFVAYKNGVGGQRRGKALKPEDCASTFEKNKHKQTQAIADRDANDVLRGQLWHSFETTLELECEEHKIAAKEALSWYYGGQNQTGFTFQREFQHRDEMMGKQQTGSIDREDPLLAEDKLGWPSSMPIEAYICSEFVKKGRLRGGKTAGKPGSSGHVSAKNAIPGYHVLMGRKPTPLERSSDEFIAYSHDLERWEKRFQDEFGKSHDEMIKTFTAPKKGAGVEQVLAQMKTFIENHPHPSDHAPIYEYTPFPWDQMSKLKATTDAFYKWVWNNNARDGPKKRNANVRNTLARQKKEADGERSSRQREPPRCTTKRKVSEDLEGIKLTSKQPGLARLKVSLTPGEHAQHEEYSSLTSIVEVLFAVAKGEYRASMEVLYTVVNHLQNSPALVFSNTHVDIEQGFIKYDTPNGARFRNMDNDDVSFLAEEIRADAAQAETQGTKSASKYDLVGSTPNSDEKLYLGYSVNGHEHRVAPYAAVFNAIHCFVDLKIDLLHKFYPEIYNDIRAMLLSWHEDYMSQNGGAQAAAERSRIPTDRVFGGDSFAVLAACPPLVSSVGASDRKSTYRVRRRRWAEMETNGGTLPETGFPLVVECKMYGLRGWMLWTAGSMWMRDEEESAREWKKMHVDSAGTLRPPWWMEGDELPEEAHDYASIVDGEMMPDQLPLLPSLF
jgi:hypothetical protein